MKNTIKKLAALFAASAAILTSIAFVSAADVNTMTPQEIVNDMGVGWNLGNSLDSCGGSWDASSAETYWGNPKTTKAMIDAVKAKGFNTVRIPVTWYEQCDSNGKINSAWLARVKEVVDYAYNNDMYVILNIHHENSKIIPDAAHKDSSKQWVVNLWSQIAPYFKDYDRHLIFEAMNEPRIVGSDEEWTTGTLETRQIISEFDQAAVDTIRAAGGKNPTRLVMCPSNAASIPASSGFTLPDDSNVVLSVHNYSPYEFAMKGDGTAYWGSDNDKQELRSQLKDLYNRYVSKGVPVVIGEMGATDKNNTSAREVWAEYYTKTAAEYGMTCVVWDNNETGSGEEHFGLLDRNSCTWSYPSIAEALVNGANEAARPDISTVDPYTSDIWEGSETKSGYDSFVVYNGALPLNTGDTAAIEYSGSDKPYLVFQNYNISGTWTQILPDSVKNGTAYYSYDTIMNACSGNYSNMNQTLVMAGGGAVTVTKLSILSAHSAGDVNNDGNVNYIDSAIILKYICGVEIINASLEYGNVNSDSVLNILDAIKILNK